MKILDVFFSIILKPGIRGHLSLAASLALSHRWPLKTGATVDGLVVVVDLINY